MPSKATMTTVRRGMAPIIARLRLMASMTRFPRIRTSRRVPIFDDLSLRWSRPSSKGPTWTYASASPKPPANSLSSLADDLDREALKTKIEAALSGAVDVLWLTDRRNRDVGVRSAKIAYVEIGTPEGERKIGFGG